MEMRIKIIESIFWFLIGCFSAVTLIVMLTASPVDSTDLRKTDSLGIEVDSLVRDTTIKEDIDTLLPKKPDSQWKYKSSLL